MAKPEVIVQVHVYEAILEERHVSKENYSVC